MALQLIMGNSGSGKSYYIYEKIIKDSIEHPEKNYLVLVPEQFTMQTQKTLADMHPGGGILNIDILSFERLAYRVFEEVGGNQLAVLEETGKSLVIQKMVQEQKENLPYLGNQMKKPGYIAQVKSMISEFMQYDIDEKKAAEIVEESKGKALLYHKLADVQVLYAAFREFLKDHYITGEEILDLLCRKIPESKQMQNCEIVLDGYTGFTPIQHKLIAEFMKLADKVYVTVTIDSKSNPFQKGNPYGLFYMSQKMVQRLIQIAKETHCPMEDTIDQKENGKTRFEGKKALQFLEQNLFRYRAATWKGEQKEIQIFEAANPSQEMDEVARRILSLVREEGYRYGEISVITGDLQEYAFPARQALERVKIPCFIDEKHSILMNPFVEYLRAALNMVVEGYSYESVFRYLRCGMSNLSREEIDELENYVVALGIRGKKRWSQPFQRNYRGMDPERILAINESRSCFVEEVKILMENFSGKGKTVEEYTRQLYAFIVNGNIQNKLKEQEQHFKEVGNLALEKEYAQIYKIVMDLFDRLVEILGAEVVTQQEYQQLLETGLSEAKVALIPPSIDQVLVGDIERTRLKGVKALFFVGVNDGNIPKNTGNAGFLTELDREYLEEKGIELAPGPRELTVQQKFYLYLNMTKPSERLYLSFAHANAKGEGKSPAYLIGTIQKLFPDIEIQKIKNDLSRMQNPENSIDYFLQGLKEEGEKDKYWCTLYTWYLEHEEYRERVEQLVCAYFAVNPEGRISESVARALYGEISPYAATRLERYAACAFAHFLRYGLELSERAEYVFKAMDMGNIMHTSLENFSEEVRRQGLRWADLTDEKREEIAHECLEKVTADYGNTILHSTSRNKFLISRVDEILKKTVWALQQQLKQGEFEPEGFEVSLAGGRIDRVDICEEDDKVYVKVIDYKTGNTGFDLLALYHGLQLQLVVYLNGAMEAQKVRHPQKEIIPAGIFYYNVKDPMLNAKMDEDLADLEKKVLGELKMKGLVQVEDGIAEKMDKTLLTLPVSKTTTGAFRKSAYLANKEQFRMLSEYVRHKIERQTQGILTGDVSVSPYQMGKDRACTYCTYRSVCGFDTKIPGYDYRRLQEFSDEVIWNLMKEEE